MLWVCGAAKTEQKNVIIGGGMQQTPGQHMEPGISTKDDGIAQCEKPGKAAHSVPRDTGIASQPRAHGGQQQIAVAPCAGKTNARDARWKTDGDIKPFTLGLGHHRRIPKGNLLDLPVGTRRWLIMGAYQKRIRPRSLPPSVETACENDKLEGIPFDMRFYGQKEIKFEKRQSLIGDSAGTCRGDDASEKMMKRLANAVRGRLRAYNPSTISKKTVLEREEMSNNPVEKEVRSFKRLSCPRDFILEFAQRLKSIRFQSSKYHNKFNLKFRQCRATNLNSTSGEQTRASGSEVTRLNKEGGEFFKNGQYEEAAKRYQSAILADSSNSSVYFFNLSAAYLKLGKFAQAESAANTSLIRDPRSVKALYRRAIARKERGRLAEALVDLTSLLTTAPGSIEASTAIEEISRIYAASGQDRISLEDVVVATFPHAFGCPEILNARPQQPQSLSTDLRLPPDIPAERPSAALYDICTTCKPTKERKEMKTCQKVGILSSKFHSLTSLLCKRATYCNATCQRGDWAGHKTTCNRPVDNNLTFRLGRQLVDHMYISTHLASYAVRAMRPAHDGSSVLLVMVDMVPTPRVNASASNIFWQLRSCSSRLRWCKASGRCSTMRLWYRDGPLLAVVIGTIGVYPEGEETRFRVSAMAAPPKAFTIALRSHSFGEERRVTMDLDLLYSETGSTRGTSGLSLSEDRSYIMAGDSLPPNPNASGSGSQPIPPRFPPRKGKTHKSEAVSKVLRDLPKSLKVKKNIAIAERNGDRALKRVLHEEDVGAYPDDASDDESTITVSEDEDAMSPASRVHAAVMASSPNSGKRLLRLMGAGGSKRSRDEDEKKESKPTSKKARVEVVISPGMSLPTVFHTVLRDLYNNDVYIPLSLFTSSNLSLINSTAATLEMIKLNPSGPTEKQIRVLNTASFEASVLRECDMDRAQWNEAAINYVAFIQSVEGENSPAVARWEAHYGFLTNVKNAEDVFPAIRATDIALRLDYSATPRNLDATDRSVEVRRGVGQR
ncbi:hypothetical protein B0H16DRAFT_1797425 [Mycena metata]|uniref:MYND-type domain-containing protein n=1 Tax=Mycena metata TaxID=1033252 RepID=A0AAD7MI06_9AGAR|nr:hypothetical protein B0H16DRAFT_1797425 [Mycena metata]